MRGGAIGMRDACIMEEGKQLGLPMESCVLRELWTPLSLFNRWGLLSPAEDGNPQLEIVSSKRGLRESMYCLLQASEPISAAEREFLWYKLPNCLPSIGMTLVETEQRWDRQGRARYVLGKHRRSEWGS